MGQLSQETLHSPGCPRHVPLLQPAKGAIPLPRTKKAVVSRRDSSTGGPENPNPPTGSSLGSLAPRFPFMVKPLGEVVATTPIPLSLEVFSLTLSRVSEDSQRLDLFWRTKRVATWSCNSLIPLLLQPFLCFVVRIGDNRRPKASDRMPFVMWDVGHQHVSEIGTESLNGENVVSSTSSRCQQRRFR